MPRPGKVRQVEIRQEAFTVGGMSALEIEPAMTYRLQVRGPLTSTDGSAPHPHVEYWEMAGATLDGPEIHATSAMPGIDWFRPSADGWGRPHVRLPFRTDDGALILLDYRGIVHASDAFVRAVDQDLETDWADQYMRMSMYFETTSERYAGLTRSLFIARGRLRGTNDLEYDVYRVR
jgi:hypothetical protein